jgi:hypothetical protein
LIRLAHPSATAEIHDKVSYRAFRNALNNHDLEWAIVQSTTESIDEALHLALKYEAYNMSKRKPTLRYQSLDDKDQANNRTFKKESRSCFYCQKEGHLAKEIGPDNKEHVIAYFSKALTKPERQYCVTRRELLAVLAAVKHVHHYLYGVHFTVRTDHGALCWLTNFKNPEGQLARWLEVLGCYNFTIKHRAGIRHGNADGLSRRPCSDCKHCDQVEGKVDINTPNKFQSVRAQRVATRPETDVEQNAISTNWLEGTTKEDLLQAQQEDKILKLVVSWLHQNSRPEWSAISHLGKLCKAYWAQWDKQLLMVFYIGNG